MVDAACVLCQLSADIGLNSPHPALGSSVCPFDRPAVSHVRQAGKQIGRQSASQPASRADPFILCRCAWRQAVHRSSSAGCVAARAARSLGSVLLPFARRVPVRPMHAI